jgi:hypothetical protein
MLQFIQLPYQTVQQHSFEAVKPQNEERFLTGFDGFNNYQFDFNIQENWGEDYGLFNQNAPKHKFLFGNYFDNYAPQELQFDTDDGKSKASEDVATEEPLGHELLSLSDQTSKMASDDECKSPESHRYSEVESRQVKKVSKTKKISKKTSKAGKSKRKQKKGRRISESLKNIVKNYGKNCATFAISELAHDDLLSILTKDQIAGFKGWVKAKLPNITNMANFREMLMPSETEDQEVIIYKRAFQLLAEIFVRDYAYNWIFHSPRISDVKGHLFARFKMLRRIRDPKNFTYIH